MLSLRIKEQKKEWIVKALFGFAMLAVCLWLMVFPIAREITLGRQRALEDQERLDLFHNVRGLNEKVSSIEASLATSADRSLMLGKISDVAVKNGIDIQNLTPRTLKEGVYTNLKIDIDGNGSFFNLLKFLRDIEALRPPVIVQNLNLSRSRFGSRSSVNGTEPDVLGIQMVLESYLKQTQRKSNP